MKKIIFVGLVICLLGIGTGFGFGQVENPSDLKFPPLKFEPPDPKVFRTQLANGLRAYIQEDHSLPLVDLSAIIGFGNLYVPKDKAGLGSLMSETLIKGGTKTKEGSVIEERVEFLGGSLSFFVSERTSALSLSVLSKDLNEGLDIFFDVLMNAEFRGDALKLGQARLIEQLRQANDQPSVVLAREYSRLLYGDHPLTWDPTRKTYEGITVADLKAVHSEYFFPKNIILTASGDFNKAQLKTKINRLIAGWKNRSLVLPILSKQFPQFEPGVYFIQKAINQGYISLGHLGIEDTNPDYFAVQVMNFILGGGSFTSRITSKVRSDEGLSYNQGSRFTYTWGFPGVFSGYVQTKSATVGYAISLILKELERIRKEPVADEEMETAINYYLESFSDNFQSPQVTMANFAMLEIQGKPMDYYKTYRDKIKAVTKEKVMEVATKYIHPEKIAIMVVGDWEPCNKGSDKLPGGLDQFGKVHRVNLRDPMTGEEIK
ncbi:MAG: pitrilysin family protein [Clostridiales bacterium]|nr:pitrilysin family protein [Clostridiales bacterium]